MNDDKLVRKLRKQLETALAKRKDDDAIKYLIGLIQAEPKAPRWPHKLGEIYQKRGKKREAIDHYTLAAGLYADQGFIARAIAMAKTVFDLDPNRIDVLERIDPDSARRLHRKQRPEAISARPAAPHPAVLPEDDVPMLDDDEVIERHSAVIPEDELPAHHAAVLPEDPPVPPTHHPAVMPETQELLSPRRPPPPPPPRPSARRPPPPPSPAAAHRPAVALDELDVPLPKVPGAPRLPDLGSSVLDLAEELTIAPDVAPTETRFSNAPPSRSLRVQLTAAELRPRQASGPLFEATPKASPATLSKLPLFPLFAELSRDALIEMIKSSQVIELQDGEMVVRAGDPADALYGIIEGSVDVVLPGQQFRQTLAEGDVFGESALLAGEKRRADVIVKGQLVAMRIGRDVFNRVIGMYPKIAELLLELLTRRLLSNLLQASPLFQELGARERQHMAQLFEVRRAPRGTLLAAIGKTMDGLYIALTGGLAVRYDNGVTEQHEPGTMFGQTSLLAQQPSDVEIRAISNMLLLRLPASAFANVVMQYPSMLAHLSELTSSTLAKVGM